MLHILTAVNITFPMFLHNNVGILPHVKPRMLTYTLFSTRYSQGVVEFDATNNVVKYKINKNNTVDLITPSVLIDRHKGGT